MMLGAPHHDFSSDDVCLERQTSGKQVIYTFGTLVPPKDTAPHTASTDALSRSVVALPLVLAPKQTEQSRAEQSRTRQRPHAAGSTLKNAWSGVRTHDVTSTADLKSAPFDLSGIHAGIRTGGQVGVRSNSGPLAVFV